MSSCSATRSSPAPTARAGDAPVLIAGAGPTGLAAAVALLAKGVACRIVDAAESPGRESSRATTLHAGTLELLDAVGLGQRLAATGARAERSKVLRGTRLLVDQDWTRLDSAYAFMLNLRQADIEDMLRQRLALLGGTVEFGLGVTEHREEGEGVTVELAGPEVGETVQCRYLVGCDGAHSTVRRGLGLALEGETYAGLFALGDARLKGGIDPRSSWLGGARGGLVGLLPLPEGWWRLNATLDEDPGDATIDFERLLRERLPSCHVEIETVAWSATYKIHRRSVAAMRSRRVLLAGDAAHLNSPIGGQGMNRGIRDAFDLAWRLAAIMDGGDEEGLLSQWERERTSDARRVLAGTDRLTRLLRARGPRGALAGLVLPVVSRIPATHDRVCAEMAGLTVSRRIASRYRGESA